MLAILLIGMLVAGVEYGRYLLAGQKADTAVSSVADMVTQATELNSTDVKDIFLAAAKILSHYEYSGAGVLIVTHVHAQTSEKPIITWQEYSSDTYRPPSKIGKVGGPAKLPKNVVMKAGSTVLVVESMVRFEPLITDIVVKGQDIYRVAYYQPRKADKIAYQKTASTAIDLKSCAGGGSPGVCGSSGGKAASAAASSSASMASSSSAPAATSAATTSGPTYTGPSEASSMLGALVGALTAIAAGADMGGITAAAAAGSAAVAAASEGTQDSTGSFSSSVAAAAAAATDTLSAMGYSPTAAGAECDPSTSACPSK